MMLMPPDGSVSHGLGHQIFITVLTHLLSNHGNTRSLSRTANTRDGEQLNKASEEVIGPRHSFLNLQVVLVCQLSGDIVHVSGCLQLRVAEAAQGVEGLSDLLLLKIPTGRLGTEVDADEQRNCWDESRAKLQPPSDRANFIHCQVRAVSQHNAESRP